MLSMTIITVSQLNMYTKTLIESSGALNSVYVSGEISNFKSHYSSGHMYFSLKDSGGAVSAVMFKSDAAKLRFAPSDGMKVIVRCRVSIYEKTGTYQIYVSSMQPDGFGELYLAYEQLKDRLSKEGLFSPERKRPIPRFPLRIGIITSPVGAARRDMENILSRRFPTANIIFSGVTVQGETAAPEMISALNEFNKKSAADVIIIGRGGGSIEDLWAFNDERLAYAIASSKIPVISAVGHETDFTIADFAADMRAPTPSAAAELCVPDRKDLLSHIIQLSERCRTAISFTTAAKKSKLNFLNEKQCLRSPMFCLDSKHMLLAELSLSLNNSIVSLTEEKKKRFSFTVSQLDSLSPLSILSRGYALAENSEKETISDISQLSRGQSFTLRMKDGSASCTADDIFYSSDGKE